jgi:hypothetical protein
MKPGSSFEGREDQCIEYMNFNHHNQRPSAQKINECKPVFCGSCHLKIDTGN